MFYDLWIYIINGFEYVFNGKTVSYRYMLGWCLCEDKTIWQHNFDNNIILRIQQKLQVVEFLSFYIWTPTKLLYKHQSMFLIFGCFDIVTIILFHEFVLLYNVWLSSCHPCDLTLLIFFFISNYPIRKTFFKLSIITESILSKVNQHLASHQFVINQVYQKRRKFWQDINSNLT